MAQWKLRIDGFGDILKEWPEEEPRISVVGSRLVALVREGLKGAARGQGGLLANVIPRGQLERADDILEELDAVEDTDGPNAFDQVLNELYDWADEQRVWLDP